jgi:menaquinone-9 beta-reductase
VVHPVPPLRRDDLIIDAPLIIGGGPAGCAAAITLGRAGYSPMLLERTAGPADKVCGDFLSVDAIRLIRTLGVDPLALGAASINRIRLIHGERIAETALPFPAVGLTRRTLDAALLHQAGCAGAVVQAGQTVRRLIGAPRNGTRRADPLGGGVPTQLGYRPSNGHPGDRLAHDGGQWTAETGDRTALTAETVFLATGKHDLRDLPRAHAGGGAIGMKMYFSPAHGPANMLDGAIELTLFPGGYAGMQHVENGRIVVCVAVQRRAFQRYGGGWPGLIAAIEQRSRRFAAMLSRASPLLPRPLAVAGVPYGYQARSVSPAGLFRLGDQAAVIPSLTGDGMAIALHSGKIAAETWLAGALAPQMRLAFLLHHASMSGLVQAGVIAGAALFPGLLRCAARRTRLPLEC